MLNSEAMVVHFPAAPVGYPPALDSFDTGQHYFNLKTRQVLPNQGWLAILLDPE